MERGSRNDPVCPEDEPQEKSRSYTESARSPSELGTQDPKSERKSKKNINKNISKNKKNPTPREKKISQNYTQSSVSRSSTVDF